MCEATAYVLKSGEEQTVLKSVDEVKIEGEEVRLTSIFGDRKTINARFKLYDNSSGKLLFEPI
jgi:predicted RNA-binding protein